MCSKSMNCLGFKSYDELEDINSKFKPVFNLQNGKKYKSNVLNYKKSYNHYLF